MADRSQLRRMIQSSRARTPAVELEDLDVVLSPTTPRSKGLKPKLSSYFMPHLNSNVPNKLENVFGGSEKPLPDLPTWSGPAPTPEAERLIDSIMSRLLGVPHERLDSSFNGSLLQIFEHLRIVSGERQRAQAALEAEVENRETIERAMRQSAEAWDRERRDYKAEIRRLELILAKGERGLAEVTLARQESVFRRPRSEADLGGDQTLDTIFRLLERSRRYEERLWHSQRATLQTRPVSPSLAMRRLSRQIMRESSKPYTVKTLPSEGVNTLSMQPDVISGTSWTTHHAQKPIDDVLPARLAGIVQHVSTPAAMDSHDTESSFSCEGDLLPDETTDANLIDVAGTDNEFVAIKRIAQVLAKRRQIDPNEIMPQLIQLFMERSPDTVGNDRPANARQPVHTSSPRPQRATSKSALTKHPSLKAKASGFFSKWRPHLTIDPAAAGKRRFSFEPGDDTNATFASPTLDTLPATVQDRLLRRSASMSLLSELKGGERMGVAPALSPVEPSPTTSTSHSGSKKSSTIPTPVYSAASLARPRADREGSMSSFLTAIRTGEGSQHSGRTSSSRSDSPAREADKAGYAMQGTEHLPGGQPASSNPLLDRTNALRGSAFAAAAARVASTTAMSSSMDGSPKRRPQTATCSDKAASSSRSRTSRGRVIMRESQLNNEGPIMHGEHSYSDQHRFGSATP